MSDIITDIVEYMDNNNLGTRNTDLFVGELPVDGGDCVAVMLSPSVSPNKSIPYFEQTIDFWSRSKSYDEGYTALQDIFEQFHRAENYELSNFHVYLSYAQGMVTDLGRDVERRHLFQLSFVFIYRDAGELS